jgi:membrane protease YdiL (CAAX protease family)
MALVKRHPIITFFVLTFVLSWWTIPLYAMGLSPSPLFPGPLFPALIVIPLTQGRAGLRALGSRMVRWRVGWRWYAVALGIPLTVAAVAWALNVALGAPAPSLATLSPLTAVFMALGIKLTNPLNGPMGEEPGWRGVALPGLQDPASRRWWPPSSSRRSRPSGMCRSSLRTSSPQSDFWDRLLCVRGHVGLQPHWRQRVHDHRYARR